MAYSHGTEWTDEMTAERILEVYEHLELTSFPTHSQMYEYYGDYSLANRIKRSGGSTAWAKKLNISIGEHETSAGNKYELICLKKLRELGFSGTEMLPRFPYDLLINRNIKVDVKSGFCYTFNLEKDSPTCDIFVIYCLNRDESIFKTLVIPSVFLSGKKQLSIGVKKSQYFVFEDEWVWFRRYDKFYRNIKDKHPEF